MNFAKSSHWATPPHPHNLINTTSHHPPNTMVAHSGAPVTELFLAAGKLPLLVPSVDDTPLLL